MTSRTLSHPSPSFSLTPLTQALAALIGGAALFVVFVIGGMILFSMAYAGRIYPGVSIAGQSLTGLTPELAAERLSERITYPQTGTIALQTPGMVWMAHPADLGLSLDAQASAQLAYKLGRSGNPFQRVADQFSAWYSGRDLPPLLIFDQRTAFQYLRAVAAQYDLPTVEASLHINGTDIVVTPGQVGRSVDIKTTLQPLEIQLRTLKDGILPLAVSQHQPAIMDASAQAEIARKILSQPLTIKIPEAYEGDPGPWTFEVPALAQMLTIARVESDQGARYQVGLDPEKLRPFLQDLAPKLSLQPADARFIFNDETRELEKIQSAVIGRALNLEATLQQVNDKAAQGEHEIGLAFDYTNPAITDDVKAADLGITELVSSQTTYFYGSSTSRIQNIKTAASKFHGVMVAPGATFSMAEVMGDVSLDTGYAEALIIYGNRTIKGVGGGVCQVSTTLFRAVFFGGFPVVERYSHAYRVSYYELDASGGVDSRYAGLDATVFVPVVDFKFTNDTPHWLLMETYTNAKARTLTWKFYSTSDGRSVDWESSGLQNIVEAPDPVYQKNPDLGAGEIRQVDWAADGADVIIRRTVLRDGDVYFTDNFATHYTPWQAVFEYGPGTKVPKVKNQD